MLFSNVSLFTKTVFSTVALIAFLTMLSAPVYADTYYPDDGDLLYDGHSYADSYIVWNNPGGWNSNNPGYEHDLKMLEADYFTGCSSWTNLPNPYNDCPTAGVDEPEGTIILAFGSFDAEKITPGKEYYGAWSFDRGPDTSADFKLLGQEVTQRNALCPDNQIGIWCQTRVRENLLLSGRLNSHDWDYWTW